MYNALQLSQLCSQAELKCDMHIYPNEGMDLLPKLFGMRTSGCCNFLRQVCVESAVN